MYGTCVHARGEGIHIDHSRGLVCVCVCVLASCLPFFATAATTANGLTVEYWTFQEKGKAKITPERIKILESIGFEWDPQKLQWQAMYEKLQDFCRQHGHSKVPKGYTKDVELANWVRNQRLEHRNWQQQKRSRMTQERFELLDKLGFVWSQQSSSSPSSKGGAKQKGCRQG